MIYRRLPAVPLRDVVAFPQTTIPLYVGRDKSVQAILEAEKTNHEIVLITQKDHQAHLPDLSNIFTVGTMARIKQFSRLSDGNVKILVEILSRVSIKSFETEPYFAAECELIPDERLASDIESKWMHILIEHVKSYFQLTGKALPNILDQLRDPMNPHELVHWACAQISLKLQDKQEILETTNPIDRIEKLSIALLSEIEIIKLDRKLKDQVREKIEKSQRDYYLNEQLQAIQKELGRDSENKDELTELESKIRAKGLPPKAEERALKEFKRLKAAGVHFPEASVIRNYLDLILDLPWSSYSEDSSNISKAEEILNSEHYGMKETKERILEFLALRSQVPTAKSPILCLVGPPGVGKTSLARSIAKCLGRNFERISLGGVRDEAELRGHRRTYVAAMPGRIISAIKNAKSSNPVILLDEIDKLGHDFRGDPASALLEILDPEQNKFFTDHFLDLEYDLSKVLFIGTANVIDTLPPALRDRLEIISIDGYSDLEKSQIFKRHLLPSLAQEHALSPEDVEISDELISYLIHEYTRESGVRGLSKILSKILRKFIVLKAHEHTLTKLVLTRERIHEFLGPPKLKRSKPSMKSEVGIVTGLAWTPMGGEVLSVEANVFPGKGKIQTTGKLGEVMQESARAAISYIRSRAHEFGLNHDFFNTHDIHIHAPEGAIPKDGPSAGITMAIALLSACTLKRVSHDIGMTGEISLRGRILPIGGLKEKLLAAKRSNLKTVFFPQENQLDLNDIDPAITKDLILKPVSHMDELVKQIFNDVRIEEIPSDFYVDQQPQGSAFSNGGSLLLFP